MLWRVPLELKAPSGLWLLGLLGPLVLLYVLKVRRQRVTVSSTWLWAAAARDIAAKSPFKRLQGQVPLILEIGALCLLAVALSRPASRAGHIAGDHVAFVVDTSASMAALEPDGRTRLAHAREAALAVIRALSPGAQAVITADAAKATGSDKKDLQTLATSPLVFPSATDYAKLRHYRALTPAEEKDYNAVFQQITAG